MGKRGPAKDSKRLEMTELRQDTFLSALRASGGVFSAACRAASPHSSPTTKCPPCYSTFRNLIQRDPDFAIAVQEVMDSVREDIEAEIFRRGQEGWDTNVYQKGEQVFNRDGTPATVKRFSDNLLLARARAMMPEKYGEKRTVEHRGTIHHAAGGHWTITSQDLAAFSQRQRENLRDLMNTARLARSGEEAPAIEHHPAEEVEAARVTMEAAT